MGSLCTRTEYHRGFDKAFRASYWRHLQDPGFPRELGFNLGDIPATGCPLTGTENNQGSVHWFRMPKQHWSSGSSVPTTSLTIRSELDRRKGTVLSQMSLSPSPGTTPSHTILPTLIRAMHFMTNLNVHRCIMSTWSDLISQLTIHSTVIRSMHFMHM